jgi:hypothetical protein
VPDRFTKSQVFERFFPTLIYITFSLIEFNR